ncbi:calcium-binding protein [Phenylobacterium sp.]|uniref:calcium-binding protein n=1 Tax=Phenylobacterium sp. TaxID=1871053 RepID=UPI0025E0AED5|nr:calcium-binding protein [Phenylobacterium sp.]
MSIINGDNNPNVLLGGAVADKINGYGGDDVISGGGGNDLLDGGTGNDVLDGGADDDAIHGGVGTNTLDGGAGDDVLYSDSGASHDNLSGGAGDDLFHVYGIIGGKIDGGAGVNTLDFGAGSATDFDGSSGTALFGNIQKVQGNLNGTAGNDVLSLSTLTGATGTLYIYGGTGNDSIAGGSEVDVIHGGDGDDNIRGGLGADQLTGGAGVDTFTYNSINDSLVANPDHITDFLSGVDKIDLRGIDANSTVAGNQAFVLVGGDHFTGLGQILVTANGQGGLIVSGNTTGDLGADFSISLDHSTTIFSTDFFL